MTELSEYLASATSGDQPVVDWSAPPWVAAHRALLWLRIAPEIATPPLAPLSTSDTMLLCDRMVARFVNADGSLAWSSHMLSTALEAISFAVRGAPEPLLRAFWELLRDRHLDTLAFNFCHAIGIEVLSRRRVDTGWDLSWMLTSTLPCQVCLRYWTIALRPEIGSDELDAETRNILGASGFTSA